MDIILDENGTETPSIPKSKEQVITGKTILEKQGVYNNEIMETNVYSYSIKEKNPIIKGSDKTDFENSNAQKKQVQIPKNNKISGHFLMEKKQESNNNKNESLNEAPYIPSKEFLDKKKHEIQQFQETKKLTERDVNYQIGTDFNDNLKAILNFEEPLDNCEFLNPELIGRKFEVDIKEIKTVHSNAFRQFTDTLQTSNSLLKTHKHIFPIPKIPVKQENAKIYFKVPSENPKELHRILEEVESLKSTFKNQIESEIKMKEEIIKNTELTFEKQQTMLKEMKENYELKIEEKQTEIKERAKDMNEFKHELGKLKDTHRNELEDITDANRNKFNELARKITQMNEAIEICKEENVS